MLFELETCFPIVISRICNAKRLNFNLENKFVAETNLALVNTTLMDIFTHTNTRTHMHTITLIQTHIRMQTHKQAHTYTLTHLHTYPYMFIYNVKI